MAGAEGEKAAGGERRTHRGGSPRLRSPAGERAPRRGRRRRGPARGSACPPCPQPYFARRSRLLSSVCPPSRSRPTRHAVRKQAGVEPEGCAFFFYELKLPEVYFSGLHQFHNGKRAKPLCGMVKVRNQFLTMGEMQILVVFWRRRIDISCSARRRFPARSCTQACLRALTSGL